MICIVIIRRNGGDVVTAYDSESGALAYLAFWARRYWVSQEISVAPPPADDGEAIYQYFEVMSGVESYSIEKTALNKTAKAAEN